MEVVGNRLAGRPMTVSSRFSSIRARRMRPSAPPGTARHGHDDGHAPSCRRAVSTMCAMKAKSPWTWAAAHARSGCSGRLRSPCTPLVETEGRVGNHHVETHQAVTFDQRRAVERVAHSMRAPSLPCRNMFIRASAQVLPLTSWPYSAKSRLPRRSSNPAASISRPPEPQVGSQIRSPGLGLTSCASSRETCLGV